MNHGRTRESLIAFEQAVNEKIVDLLKCFEEHGFADATIEPPYGGLTVREYLEYLRELKWKAGTKKG